MADKAFNIAGMIVVVGGVTAVLLRGSAASQLVGAFGNAFSGALKTAING